MDIIKNNSSKSKFIFTEDRVIKTFPIESGLHYDIAVRLFEFYKEIGLDISYDITFTNTEKNIGFFTTSFPKLETLSEVDNSNVDKIDLLLARVITKYPISTLESYKNRLNVDNITIHTRDSKNRNLFKYKNDIYLLDIADFYFTIKDKDNNTLEISDEFKHRFNIKDFIYKQDEKYTLPKFVYTYEFKEVLKNG